MKVGKTGEFAEMAG